MSRRTVLYVVIAVGVAGCLLMLFALLAKVGDQANSAREASDSNRQILAAIQDCLNKGGSCYKSAQKQHEADRWTQILAAACAAGYADLPPDERVIRTFACVTAHVHGATQLGDPPRRQQ